jgi:hypothetical protein
MEHIKEKLKEIKAKKLDRPRQIEKIHRHKNVLKKKLHH